MKDIAATQARKKRRLTARAELERQASEEDDAHLKNPDEPYSIADLKPNRV